MQRGKNVCPPYNKLGKRNNCMQSVPCTLLRFSRTAPYQISISDMFSDNIIFEKTLKQGLCVIMKLGLDHGCVSNKDAPDTNLPVILLSIAHYFWRKIYLYTLHTRILFLLNN